jgi:predicted transcriptional regulator
VDAERSLIQMEIKAENTVVTPVISVKDLVSKKLPMTAEQFEAEKKYAIADSIFRKMHENGLITKSEYRKLNTIITKKYGSISGSLLW